MQIPCGFAKNVHKNQKLFVEPQNCPAKDRNFTFVKHLFKAGLLSDMQFRW